MDKVYVITEDWKINSGESGVSTSVFSSFKNAKKHFEQLIENYKQDYIDNEDMEIALQIDDKLEILTIEGTCDTNADYYKIWVDEKKVDEYL